MDYLLLGGGLECLNLIRLWIVRRWGFVKMVSRIQAF